MISPALTNQWFKIVKLYYAYEVMQQILRFHFLFIRVK